MREAVSIAGGVERSCRDRFGHCVVLDRPRTNNRRQFMGAARHRFDWHSDYSNTVRTAVDMAPRSDASVHNRELICTTERPKSSGEFIAWQYAGLIIAIILLASIAWAGHAGATIGAERPIHLTVDSTHLIAAGLWPGGLLPLTLLLFEHRNQMTRHCYSLPVQSPEGFPL